ncbi:MAG: phosphotransferase [bacterium]
MTLPKLSENQIKEVFIAAEIGVPKQISKLGVGFSNDVYSIDDTYIFKAIRDEEDEIYLKKEIYLCGLFQNKLPVPVIAYSDTNKLALDRGYVIYEKIKGDNLYMRWHEYSVDERKAVVKQICSYLRIINETPYQEFAANFGIDTTALWRNRMMANIEEHAAKAIMKGGIEPGFVHEIRKYVEENAQVLDESKTALTYYDVHFDNFIVRDMEVVGMLDFERTDIRSAEYVLDVVQRMVNEPMKYASEAAEPLIRPEDYADLMEWYREFYPELFSFNKLGTRLALYAIDHDLEQLFWWPESESLKASLAKTIAESK